MIQMFMFFALGFLTASLLVVIVVPFVHKRAERLTVRRVEASMPQSFAEIHADRDHLRAAFAISTRRLELSIEQLRAKTASQLAELGRKTAVINRLMVELDARTATVSTSKKRAAPPLRAAADEFSVKTGWLRAAERSLADKDAEVAKLTADLDERSRTADRHRVEIVALKVQIDVLKDQVTELGRRRAQERLAPERRRTIMRVMR
jgi:chromosome segregation ATPase